MTKDNIAKIIVNKTGIGKQEVSAVIEAFMATVMNVTSTGLDIHLRGFGTFKVIHRKAKKGRDIRAKKTVEIPARNEVIFVKSKYFPAPSLTALPSPS